MAFSSFLGVRRRDRLSSLTLPYRCMAFNKCSNTRETITTFKGKYRCTRFPMGVVGTRPLSRGFTSGFSRHSFLNSLVKLKVGQGILNSVIVGRGANCVFYLSSVTSCIIRGLSGIQRADIGYSIIRRLPTNTITRPRRGRVVITSLELSILTTTICGFSHDNIGRLFIRHGIFIGDTLYRGFSCGIGPNSVISMENDNEFGYNGILNSAGGKHAILRVFICGWSVPRCVGTVCSNFLYLVVCH